MKTIYKQLTAGLLFITSGCTNLDEQIWSQIPKDEFFQSEEQLVVYAARAYTKLQAWGSEQSLWTLILQLGNEIAAPVNSTGDWKDPRYGELQTHKITQSNKLVRQGWDYCFDGIAACNDVIYEIQNSPFEFDGKNRIIAEMKVMRALYYFFAADLWGNVPFSVNKEDTGYPPQKDRAFIFNFIEKEIKDNIDYLAELPSSEYYGRMTQGVAHTLLAKLYLNAEVWLGTEMWSKAEAEAKAVIDSGFYNLESNYKTNFIVNNELSKEQILAIPYSTVHTTSDHNDFIIFIMTLSPKQCLAMNIPAAGWDGFIAQPDFFTTYEDADKRKAQTWIFGEQKDKDGNTYIINPIVEEAEYAGRPEDKGAKIGKWDYQTDGLLASDQVSMDNDFFVFRYADVILMYAEALVRQGRSSEAISMQELKTLRTRSGLPMLTSLTLEELYSERSHEMALEGWARQDLIRFGKYQEVWWCKPERTADYALLLPIPLERLRANPELKQNEGYN